MTREEAINILRQAAWLGSDANREQTEQAVDMAISALEQYPCIYDLKNRYCPRLNEHGMLKYPLQEQITSMSTDAISREAVKEQIYEYVISGEYCQTRGTDLLLKRIGELPSVTRQTGEWIDDEFGSKCGCCGIHTHLDKFDRPMKFKYCSMCGAKMVEPQESEG